MISVRLWLHILIGRFRQYGLWERYAELYPDKDLIYTVGVSDYTKDWFYAQCTRCNSFYFYFYFFGLIKLFFKSSL